TRDLSTQPMLACWAAMPRSWHKSGMAPIRYCNKNAPNATTPQHNAAPSSPGTADAKHLAAPCQPPTATSTTSSPGYSMAPPTKPTPPPYAHATTPPSTSANGPSENTTD